MIKPAHELKRRLSKQQVIDFLEDYLMEIIEKSSKDGYTETSITGYSISINAKTGEMQRGLHHRDRTEDLVWQWKSVRDYNEVLDDLRTAGYRVYDKDHNGCIWVNWEV